MPVVHRNAVGAVSVDREDLGGQPFGRIEVQLGFNIASLHVGPAGLMSVATALIELANEMILGKETSVRSDNNADIRTPDAEAM